MQAPEMDYKEAGGERRGGKGREGKETGLFFPSCYCASFRGSDDVDSSETQTVSDVVDGEETGPEL